MTTPQTIDATPAPSSGYSRDIAPAQPPFRPRLPWLRICQPGSADAQTAGMPIGHFFVEQTILVADDQHPDGQPVKKFKDIGSSVHILPLALKTPRILFTDGEDGQILCASEDGIWGVGTPGGDCFSCPKAKWGDNNTPPPCPETLEFAAYCPQVECLVRVQFQRGGLKLGRAIHQACHGRWAQISYQFGLERITKGAFNYFIIRETELTPEVHTQLVAHADSAAADDGALAMLLAPEQDRPAVLAAAPPAPANAPVESFAVLGGQPVTDEAGGLPF